MKKLYILFALLLSTCYLPIQSSESFLKRKCILSLQRLIRIEEDKLQKEERFASQLSQTFPTEDHQNNVQQDAIQNSQNTIEEIRQRIKSLKDQIKNNEE